MKKKRKKCRCNKHIVTSLHPAGSAADFQVELPPPRVLIRPKIHYFRVALYIIMTAVVDCGIYYAFYYLFEHLVQKQKLSSDFNSFLIALLIAIFAFLLFIFIVRKQILIWFVHLYQRYASDDIRLRCVYTPSCSEYMILSIQKYGVIRGIRKGMDRLKRCHEPNGGEDYP